MRRFVKFLLVICLVFGNSYGAQTQESMDPRVLSLEQEINVNEDGLVSVSEFFVLSIPREIGEYNFSRRLPYEYEENQVRITAKEVNVNEEDVKYSSSYDKDCFYIRMDEEIGVGIYSFIVSYDLDNVIDFGGDTNDFVFRLLGEGWSFPIEKFSATVTFPEGTVISSSDSKVMKVVNDSKNYDAGASIRISDNVVSIAKNSVVTQGEDLLLDVSFFAGTVSEKSFGEKVNEFWSWNAGSCIVLVLSLMMILGVAVFYRRMSFRRESDGGDLSFACERKMVACMFFAFLCVIVLGAGILVGSSVSGEAVSFYVRNVLLRFLQLAVVCSFVGLLVYYVIRYEVAPRGIFYKVVGTCVSSVLLFGLIVYCLGFAGSIYYNWFGYLSLFVLYLSVCWFMVLTRMKVESEGLEEVELGNDGFENGYGDKVSDENGELDGLGNLKSDEIVKNK